MRFVAKDDLLDLLIDEEIKRLDPIGGVRRYMVKSIVQDQYATPEAGPLPENEGELRTLIDDCIQMVRDRLEQDRQQAVDLPLR